MADAGSAAVRRRLEAVWRIEAARVVGGLARVTGDVGRAEDLAQEALLAALEQWPATGVPDNPAAWLTTVARRRHVDDVRRRVTAERTLEEIGRAAELAQDETEDPMAGIETAATVRDDVLRLMFTACHPVLPPEGRVALTLRLVGGLATDEIARAFLVPVPTMAARITRAKKALSASGVPFEVPVGDELAPRLASVLEVLYLVFNEGYSATSGDTLTRPVLCEEAMRVGRVLLALLPTEGEVAGLVALMELQASRLPARTDAAGQPVLLTDQDRARWDRTLIAHALRVLDESRQREPGPYAVQAAIAACHARARSVATTDWVAIARHYGELVTLTGSPVVELNRAVAVGMADGPAAGLAVLDALIALDVPALRSYHLVAATRGDLLERLARPAEARAAFERAAALTANERERDLLRARALRCG